VLDQDCFLFHEDLLPHPGHGALPHALSRPIASWTQQ
jgi:hypothetical protein